MMSGSDRDGTSIFVVGSFVAACSVKVERLPRLGETVRAQSFILEAGGKGFNMAVAAHRLGASVDGVLAVGSDHFTSLAQGALLQAGLPDAMLVRFAGATGAGVGFVDPQGENCIAVCPAANDLLSAREIDAAGERLMQAGVVAAQFEVGDGPIIAAFAAAAGAVRVLNPSPFRPLAHDLLGMTDILVVNAVEAAALASAMEMPVQEASGEGSQQWAGLAAALLERGVEVVIVTLGAGGAVAWAPGECVFQPAFAVEAVDTVGAGDAFLGGLMAALATGAELAEGLRWGAACGALATTRIGLLDALPTRAKLEEMLQREVLFSAMP